MTITRSGSGWIDQPGSLLGLLNLGLGLVLLMGAPSRTASPSLAVARQIMPIRAWGSLFLAAGFVCLAAYHYGRWGAVLVGAGAGIHAFWAGALLQAATHDKRAALTGVVVYGWLAMLHFTTAIRLARRAG
jgi:hypothetical protein